MKLAILHTSDTHGFITPTSYQDKSNYSAPFSLSRVSTLIAQQREKYGEKNVLVTDSGDSLQGSPLASYLESLSQDEGLKKLSDAYNIINYDARVVGNHDFNFGFNYLKNFIANDHATFLNDNVLNQNTDAPAFGQKSIIIEKAGIKIGIVGVTTQYISKWEPIENIPNLKFVSAYEGLKSEVKKIRPKVDILVALYHGGFESDLATGKPTEPHNGENEGYKIFEKIPEIDVFLTGHQHRRLNLVKNNMAIVQPGHKGETVAEVIIDFEKDSSGNVKINNLQTQLLEAKEAAPDKKIMTLMKGLDKKTQEWLDKPIATLSQAAPIKNAIEGRLKGAPFINLIHQMQLFFTKADLSATAIMAEDAGGFSKNVTMREILLNYPFANQLAVVKVSGADIRKIIEHSLSFLDKDKNGEVKFEENVLKPKNMLFNFDLFYPVHYEADINKPVGQRLTKLTLYGEQIKDDHLYRLAVNNYRALGGGFYPGYSMDKIEKIYDQDYVQLFEKYLNQVNVDVDSKKNYSFY